MFGIDDVIGGALSVINKFIPDATEREKAQAQLTQTIQDGVQKLLEGQLEINKAEAQSSNMFVAGWRPAIGWVGATALFCYYVPYMLIVTGIWLWMTIKIVLLACTGEQGCLDVHLPARPDLGVTDLLGLLGSLLGVGTMRTVEKVSGVDTSVSSPTGVLGFAKSIFK